MLEPLAAVYSQCPICHKGEGHSETQASPNAGTVALRVVDYNNGNTCASLVYSNRPFGSASNLLNGSTHFGHSRVIASARKKRPLNAGLKAEAEVSDAAWASEKAAGVRLLGIETCRRACSKMSLLFGNTRSYARKSCHRYQVWSCCSRPSAHWRRSASRYRWSLQLHLVRGYLADRWQSVRHNEYRGRCRCSTWNSRWPCFHFDPRLSQASSATNRRCRYSSLVVEPPWPGMCHQ